MTKADLLKAIATLPAYEAGLSVNANTGVYASKLVKLKGGELVKRAAVIHLVERLTRR